MPCSPLDLPKPKRWCVGLETGSAGVKICSQILTNQLQLQMAEKITRQISSVILPFPCSVSLVEAAAWGPVQGCSQSLCEISSLHKTTATNQKNKNSNHSTTPQH